MTWPTFTESEIDPRPRYRNFLISLHSKLASRRSVKFPCRQAALESEWFTMLAPRLGVVMSEMSNNFVPQACRFFTNRM